MYLFASARNVPATKGLRQSRLEGWRKVVVQHPPPRSTTHLPSSPPGTHCLPEQRISLEVSENYAEVNTRAHTVAFPGGQDTPHRPGAGLQLASLWDFQRSLTRQ